ncbi:MAG: hypothetical protein CMK89_08910 [Pseudomonadales bacterium]|nr:hypothetical protein [Pseudomonadales bacterium]
MKLYQTRKTEGIQAISGQNTLHNLNQYHIWDHKILFTRTKTKQVKNVYIIEQIFIYLLRTERQK